jgi:hypothetical protein
MCMFVFEKKKKLNKQTNKNKLIKKQQCDLMKITTFNF